MSTEPTHVNPYTPAVETPQDDSLDSAAEETPLLSLPRTAARWFTVCGISALPSFFLGFLMTEGQVYGMLLGILTFAVGYTLIDFKTAPLPIRQKKMVRLILRIVYGTRIALTVIFPIGVSIDMFCGAFSLNLVAFVANSFEAVGSAGSEMTFGMSFVTTLVQGFTLNAVLLLYGLVVLSIFSLINWYRR
ncbi:MAG: hypothetical protein P8L85_09175 [Rubripirellula sp.]|nr:hypothetical protein [Rubripirellula sp.]